MRKITTILMLLITVVILPLSAFSQLKTYSFQQVDSLYKLEQKNTVIFIHTDWCKYCQLMENTTLVDEQIIKHLNENFLFVKLNAEEKNDILFNGHTFHYKPTGNYTGVHELAEQLGTLNGKLSYPALCILNSDYEIIFQYDQFLSSADLLKVLTHSSIE